MFDSLFTEEELTSGEISVKVNYGVIPIVDESLDLCDLITQINYQCPVSKGSFPIKTSQIIPSYIPSVRKTNDQSINYFIAHLYRAATKLMLP